MTPYYEDNEAGIVIYHGDALLILPQLAWEGDELVVSDPPYGTGGWRRLAEGQGSNPSGTLVREAWDEGDTEWLCLVGTDAVMSFWPPARTTQLLVTAERAGFTKHRTLYMRKPDPKPLPGGRTRWSVEPIWVLSHDGFILTGGDDLYEACQPRKGRDRDATGHPYEKPLDVMKWLIAKTDRPTIVDPYMGSGTTLLAARIMGRRAIGIEQDEQWCQVAAKRLQQAVLPLGGL